MIIYLVVNVEMFVNLVIYHVEIRNTVRWASEINRQLAELNQVKREPVVEVNKGICCKEVVRGSWGLPRQVGDSRNSGRLPGLRATGRISSSSRRPGSALKGFQWIGSGPVWLPRLISLTKNQPMTDFYYIYKAPSHNNP